MIHSVKFVGYGRPQKKSHGPTQRNRNSKEGPLKEKEQISFTIIGMASNPLLSLLKVS